MKTNKGIMQYTDEEKMTYYKKMMEVGRKDGKEWLKKYQDISRRIVGGLMDANDDEDNNIGYNEINEIIETLYKMNHKIDLLNEKIDKMVILQDHQSDDEE